MTDFSMKITTSDEAPTVREIGIFGAMTINHAGEIRTTMLEALAEADEVRLEMAQVKEIDLMGLQLICSAHRTSVSMNKRFILGGCRASVKEAMQDSGFKRFVGCEQDVDHTCIWIQGGK